MIFDRLEATRPDLPKHWFLHLPTEPELSGAGDTATWVSDPAGDTDLIFQPRKRSWPVIF